jgi:hypothetical protein
LIYDIDNLYVIIALNYLYEYQRKGNIRYISKKKCFLCLAASIKNPKSIEGVLGC